MLNKLMTGEIRVKNMDIDVSEVRAWRKNPEAK
jgi:hypothetical protein